MNFVKIYDSILASSVWDEDPVVTKVWITLLVMADYDGMVHAWIPGIANAARVTREQCHAALERLAQPDPYSKSPELDGRRIELLEDKERCVRIVNHSKYRDQRTQKQQQDAERQKAHRANTRHAPSRDVTVTSQPVTACHALSQGVATELELELELDSELRIKNSPLPPTESGERPAVREPAPRAARSRSLTLSGDALEVWEHWKSKLGKTEAAVVDSKRKARIEWALAAYGLSQCKRAIDGCAASDWHTGRDPATGGKRYDDLTLIFRDAEKVERFLVLGGESTAKKDDGWAGVEAQLRRMGL